MGMFDIVNIKCPNCGKIVEFQSKAGECMMNVYTIGNIPPIIAGDLHNEYEICNSCDTAVMIEVQCTINSYVYEP